MAANHTWVEGAVFKSLDAATATGAGTAFELRAPCRTYTMNKTVAGTFSALVVALEGSLDNVNWYTLGTDNTTAAGATFVVDKPAKFVRANCTTFTGGTSVTAWIAATA